MATATAPVRSFPPIASRAADGRAQMLVHVDQEIAALKGELGILQETRRALSGRNGATTPTTRVGNGHRTASRRTRQRSPMPTGPIRGVTEATVMTALRAGNHDQTPLLAKALKSTPETILRRLKTLEAKGQVRREGTRAQTRWIATGV